MSSHRAAVFNRRSETPGERDIRVGIKRLLHMLAHANAVYLSSHVRAEY